MSRSDKYWAALGAAWVAAFLYGEGKAFYTHDAEATMTYYYRARLGIHPVAKHRMLGRAALWGFALWFAYHLDTGKAGLPWKWEIG